MSRTSERTPLAAFLHSPLHAFGLPARERAPAPEDGIVACELPHLGYLYLRGHADDPDFRRHTAEVLGTPLPLKPRSLCGFTGPSGSGVALWMSPDEWLLVCRRSQREQLLHSMRDALLDVFAQVVDNSGGLTTVRLTGPQYLTLLRHLGPYDFEQLAPGSGTGTVMSKATVMVLRTDSEGVMLIFRRSFADYLWRLIECTAQPYGLCIAAPAHCADPLFTPLFEAA